MWREFLRPIKPVTNCQFWKLLLTLQTCSHAVWPAISTGWEYRQKLRDSGKQWTTKVLIILEKEGAVVLQAYMIRRFLCAKGFSKNFQVACEVLRCVALQIFAELCLKLPEEQIKCFSSEGSMDGIPTCIYKAQGQGPSRLYSCTAHQYLCRTCCGTRR